MRKSTGKALYLFLCSILGMVLLAMLHRAVFVLYDLLLMADYDAYSFGMKTRTVMTFDFTTLLIALFLGGWYGIVLGMEWYSSVYGPNAETPAKLFHTFVPHHWRKKRSISSEPKSASHTSIRPTSKVAVTSNRDTSDSVRKEWSFEELLADANKKKAVARKAPVKKAVRKTVKRVKTTVAE
jgi:hypothetical protein